MGLNRYGLSDRKNVAGPNPNQIKSRPETKPKPKYRTDRLDRSRAMAPKFETRTLTRWTPPTSDSRGVTYLGKRRPRHHRSSGQLLQHLPPVASPLIYALASHPLSAGGIAKHPCLMLRAEVDELQIERAG